jgi:hypothetical protein
MLTRGTVSASKDTRALADTDRQFTHGITDDT